MFRSLELRTTQLVMRGLSTFEDQGDFITQATPSEPDFWFGNCLIQKSPSLSPEEAVERFDTAFPDARHRCIIFDFDDPPLGWYEEKGWEIECDDVLSLRHPPDKVSLPAGYALRALETEQDWRSVFRLGVQIGAEEAYDPVAHRSFLAKRYANRRRQVADGYAIWMGAFRRGNLAASMGVMIGDGLIRFQDVQTAEEHRRKGLCSALLRATLQKALARDPDALPVIVAEKDSDAGRIYRRAGFALAEQSRAALMPGYASGRSAAVT